MLALELCQVNILQCFIEIIQVQFLLHFLVDEPFMVINDRKKLIQKAIVLDAELIYIVEDLHFLLPCI